MRIFLGGTLQKLWRVLNKFYFMHLYPDGTFKLKSVTSPALNM